MRAVRNAIFHLLAMCAVVGGFSYASLATAALYGAPTLYATTKGAPAGVPGNLAVGFGNMNGDMFTHDMVVVRNIDHSLYSDEQVDVFTQGALGDMTLATGYNTLQTPCPDDVVVADLNHDGKQDVVVLSTACGNYNSGYYNESTVNPGISIALGDGAGHLTAKQFIPMACSYGDAKILVRDMNGDGIPDIVYTSTHDCNAFSSMNLHIGVFLGKGDGTFATSPIDYDTGGAETVGEESLAIGDFDGDGKPDIMVIASYVGVLFYKGNGDGTLQSPQVIVSDATMNSADLYNTFYAAAADLDGDGKLDYVFSGNGSSGHTFWLKGNGNGSFSALKAIGPGLGGVFVADLNGDGRKDVVVGNQIYVQDSSGNFSLEETLGDALTTTILGISDLNRDGRPDLVMTSSDPSKLAIYLSIAGAPVNDTLTGEGQSTAINTPFSQPVTVTVTDASHLGVSGLYVDFVPGFNVLTDAGATLGNYSPYTDAQGRVTVQPTANGITGCYLYHLNIRNSVGGTIILQDDFLSCNIGPSTMTINGGFSQSTLINTAFASALQVKVVDGNNVAQQGIKVTFSAPTTGASAQLSSATATTDVNGLASVNASANGITGNYWVSASASGLAPVEFSLTNTGSAGTAAKLVLNGFYDNVSTSINAPFLNPFWVQLVDSTGNPVANGATLVFTVQPAGNGASVLLSSTTAVTGDVPGYSSVATVTGTANGIAGSYLVDVGVQGNPNVPHQFLTLHNNAVNPVHISIAGGSGQSATVNTGFAQSLQVLVTDLGGNPAPQEAVLFIQPGSGASADLSQQKVLTDSSGIATISATANGTAGSYQIEARIYTRSPTGGITSPVSVFFALTNNAAPPPPATSGNTTVAVPTLSTWALLLLPVLMLLSLSLTSNSTERDGRARQ